ncbi:DUF6241 domain-containing protein [Neobacillus drentensis]|uniref:DUF6241 domain-containing protein n=1 Tax=Neobacillus drentensis TaxID=220684 RepID=UPI002FFEF523
MKKTLIYTGFGLAIVIGGTYAVLSLNGEKKEAAATTTKQVVTQQVHKVSQVELDEAAKTFSNLASIQKDDDFFYYATITLALQKLEVKGEKDFTPPNTPSTIERYQMNRANLQYLKNKVVETKASELYQKILDKWLKGDFSDIQNDLSSVQKTRAAEGGLPTKVRAQDEEQKYIQTFFGDKGLQINKRDWQ